MSTMRAHHAIAVVAVILISFGVKMFFFSAPTAEADVKNSRISLAFGVLSRDRTNARAAGLSALCQ